MKRYYIQELNEHGTPVYFQAIYANSLEEAKDIAKKENYAAAPVIGWDACRQIAESRRYEEYK